MKYVLNILVIAVMLCMCGSCARQQSAAIEDFSLTSYSPSHASGFEIREDSDGNRLICVTRPWQGVDVPMQTLAILDKGEATSFDGQYIVGAAQRVVCMSSSHVAMLDAIDRAEYIVGVSGKQYIMNSTIASSPEVKDVGYDSSLNYELLVMLKPDIVLLYGVSAEDSVVTSKLRELKIPYLYLGDYTEQSPLGKAEWLVLMAEIVGCREHGEEIFRGIVERYNDIRNNITFAKRRQKVMLNAPYQDVWYMPSDDSYMVRLIEDAGAEYIYKGRNLTGGSTGISLEEAYMLVSESDIWLNVGQCQTLDELADIAPHFMATDVVLDGCVYNNDKRRTPAGGSDFWESAIVHPDVVLNDLVGIFSGNDDELYYHRRLIGE